jgi:hypothetical protein
MVRHAYNHKTEKNGTRKMLEKKKHNISVIFVTVSFIGGGNQSIPRKPLTCRKSLTNFIS